VRRAATSTTLARHWVPERSLVSDAGLVIAFSLLTGAALGARLGTASMLACR